MFWILKKSKNTNAYTGGALVESFFSKIQTFNFFYVFVQSKN